MLSLAAISLLAPAMTLGVVLVALPIAAHLLNRKARRRIVFPSVELLSAAAASQSSIFRLRRLLLLLLRCLVVIALVLAFAQPTWQSAEAQRAGREGAGVVFLIDRSASTGQIQAGVAAIRSLKAGAAKAFDALTPGEDDANIVYADARPGTAFVSMTANPHALRSELETIEPTFERADLTAALALAGQVLRDRRGPMRLVIVSDMQASNWDDALKRLQQDALIPAQTVVTVIPPGGESPGNLSLHDAQVRPASPRVGRPVSLTVKLTNHSDSVQPATVRVEVGSRAAGTRSVSVDPRREQDLAFDATFDRPGEHRVVFTLSSDGLESDNVCYQVVRVVEQTPVVVITDDDTDAPGSAGYFLSRALAPHGNQLDRYDVRRLHSIGEWPVLTDAATVFVGDIGTLDENNCEALYAYMEQGGVVVFFCGDGSVVDNLAAMDRLNPRGVLPWRPVTPREFDARETTLTIAEGDWRSPLLSPFDEAAQVTFGRVRIGRAWTGGATDPDARTLLRYSDGTPALVRRGVGAGRLAIANFGIADRHSDFGKHGLFVALMQAMVEEAQDARLSHEANLVGRSVSLTTATSVRSNGPAPRVFGPGDGRTVEAGYTATRNGSLIVIDSPDIPGFYTAQQGETVLGTAAVNTDPREGDLMRIAEDELIAALRAHTPDAAVHSADAAPDFPLRGRSLWGWLVMGAFALFGMEMLLLGYWRR